MVIKLLIFLAAFVSVQCVKKKCDVLVENVKITPNHPKLGDRVAVSYSIRNDGPDTLNSGSYVTYVYFDDKVTTENSGPASERKAGEYSAFGKANGYYNFILEDIKLHTVKIIVIPNNNVIDEDMSNNEINFSIDSNGLEIMPIIINKNTIED